MPPACAIVVATAPTTPWSGAVCRRMVMEYDEVVAAMPRTFSPHGGYRQVGAAVRPPGVTTDTSFALLGRRCKNALHVQECNPADASGGPEAGHRATHPPLRARADRRARARQLDHGGPGRGRRRLATHPVQLLPRQGRRRPRRRSGAA